MTSLSLGVNFNWCLNPVEGSEKESWFSKAGMVAHGFSLSTGGMGAVSVSFRPVWYV